MKKLPIFTLLLLSIFVVWCNKQTQVENTTTWPNETGTYTMDSWKTIIPESCKSFNDWCNTCMRSESDPNQVGCTKMFCETYGEPYCLDESWSDEIADDSASIVSGDNYVNMKVEDAQALAAQNNIPFRVIETDWKTEAVTADYVKGRVSAKVQDGIVTSFTVEE